MKDFGAREAETPLFFKSFISSLREILQQYGCMNQKRVQFIDTAMDYNAQTITNHLPKIQQTIITALKNHQRNMIRSNRKLQFYSILRLIKAALSS